MSDHDRGLIAARSPVDGLRRRRLPFLPVFAQAVAAVAPAGAMGVIPGLVSGATPANLVLTFGAAMAVIVLVAFCLRPMTQRMAAVSGLYSYTAKGLGPLAAITAGWSAMLGYGLVAMASLLAVGTYGSQLVINLGIPLHDPMVFSAVVVLAVAGVAGFLMVRGIQISAWFMLLMESVAIGLLVIVMVFYFVLNARSMDLGSVFAWNGGLDSFWVGIVVAVSAFTGFESTTTLGGEAHKPFVSIPRAITWTPLATGVLYLFSAAAQGGPLRQAAPGAASGSTTLPDLFSGGSPLVAAALDLGIAASWFACVIASVNALARIFFCMGREGVVPRIVGGTHPSFRTPWVAIMILIPVIALVPVVIILSGASPEQGLVGLFLLGAYGNLGAYVLASASLPFFLRRIGEGSRRNWALGVVAALAIGAVLVGALSVPFGGGHVQAFIYGAVILASVLYTVFLRLRFPARLAAVGVYDETRELDLFQGRSPL